MRFFVRSYSRRGASSKNPSNRHKAEKAIQDAAHGVDREFDSLGKSAEEGLDNMAKNIKKSNGSNGTPKGKQRRVSSSIESIKGKFEPESDSGESLQPSASRTSSLSSGTLKKKASQNTDKLRRMFEQPEAKTKQAIEKVEETAEAIVQETEQAAKAVVQRAEEAASMADDRSSIAEEDEQEYPEGRRKSLAEEIGQDHLDGESWANIKDHHEEAKEEPKEERSNSTPSVTSEQGSSLQSPSPKKSKIPQPAKKEARSRSPVKPAKVHSAIPRPASAGASTTLNTNGKQQSSTTSSMPASEKGAQGVPASNTATLKDTENTTPSTSGSTGSSGSVIGSSGAHKAGDVKKVESDTNVGHEQDSSASADVDSKKQRKKNKSTGAGGVGGQSGKQSLPKNEESEGAWFGNKHEAVGGEKASAQNLSTTEPKEDVVSYADKIKEEGVEG